MRRLVRAATITLGSALAGCAHAQPVAIGECAGVAAHRAPFVPAVVPSLVGEYRFLLRGGAPGQHPALVRGTLSLWEPDSLARDYDPQLAFTPPDSAGRRDSTLHVARWIRRADSHTLHGATDVDWNQVSFYPPGRTTMSRAPTAPGLRVERDTLFAAPHPLGFVTTHHAPLPLRIRGVGEHGFWGDWHRPASGGYLPHPGTTGQFCAIRVGA